MNANTIKHSLNPYAEEFVPQMISNQLENGAESSGRDSADTPPTENMGYSISQSPNHLERVEHNTYGGYEVDEWIRIGLHKADRFDAFAAYEDKGVDFDMTNYQMQEIFLNEPDNCSTQPTWTSAQPTLGTFPYASLDEVRKHSNLYGFAKSLPLDRLNNSLRGKKVDIIEDESGNVFLRRVPKKMLVLFCGRPAISRVLRTLSTEDKSEQQILVPPSSTNHVGLKILVSWMTRACKIETSTAIKPFRTPKNLFAAISLARTLQFFDLNLDARRVDTEIAAKLFRRPIYPDEVKEIWNLIPKDSKYTYRMVQHLAHSMYLSEHGNPDVVPRKREMLAFLDNNPNLKARVTNRAENEKYKSIVHWSARRKNRG
ncbi:hypothetical protein CC78DRAFT_540494 [Lojkania enalia]|uniref:Uncharacterized protein n=1 Tax=Lojkania enalia TaxID=147567 RepID=A0A9P4TMU2_9PLEO|nr:hypothetical protein CC78DRAFT_540494 [Didymosphaeria enalia]